MWYRRENNTVILSIYVQPCAKRTEIVGFHGDAIKIRLASQPIDGRANDALLKYVAKLFDVPLRQVELHQGDKSRYKKVSIVGSKVDPIIYSP